ncbi:MAG TPA: hypothetical protein VD858_14475 [Reyranella sp.]|nr:hypothetical protein [Reyranella sp.]
MITAEGFLNEPVRIRTRFRADQVSTYVVASIPVVNARTLAAARVLFGALLLYFWLAATAPDSLAQVAVSGPRHHFLKVIDATGVLTALSGSVVAQHLIYWSVVALLVAFIAGALIRLVYPAMVALIWLATFLNNGDHSTTPLLLALVVTIPAPWGERWSVDSYLHRRSREPLVASPFYGYPIWLLGLTIAITYTTAGLSKIVVTEGRWFWETGARNGFIQDFGIAATDWGMLLTNNYMLALSASMVSALGQGIYIWSCFTRRALVKYSIAFGIAVPFVIGLIVFMGHFWWWWVVLIVMLYIPWALVDPLLGRSERVTTCFSGSPRQDWHRRWLLGAAAALVGLHVFAVVTKTEYEPLYSNYKMYAQGMQAGSKNEEKFWANYKTNDRHYQVAIQLVGAGGTADLGSYYQLAFNLSRFRLWHLAIADINPVGIMTIADAGTAIEAATCASLQFNANSYAVDGEAHTVRFARRYIDIVNGQMTWLPITQWIEVNLTEAGCPYHVVKQ